MKKNHERSGSLPEFQRQTRMVSTARVTIHESQFPENVRRDLLDSLRSRRVNHKFHYDSVKQTNRWLALHQAHSPSRNDEDCAATYDQAFTATAGAVGRLPKGESIHVVGLGCGGGQKDLRLLKLLSAGGRPVCYTPCDVALAMTLVARRAARTVLADADCFPLVCDLATTEDLPQLLAAHAPSGSVRVVTFFGMIPNFEPGVILPRLASVIRPGDFLLFSANLAPGPDYNAGVAAMLPQYNNALTREWLTTFLLDLGVERSDGTLSFGLESESGGGGWVKIVARFHFSRSRRLEVEGESFEFTGGEEIQLFCSYRLTPAMVDRALEKHGLGVVDHWLTRSGEEGVFRVQRR